MVRTSWILVLCLAAAGCSSSVDLDRRTGPGNVSGKADGFDWGSGCEDGSGSFTQHIAYRDVVTVGTIPADIANVIITLSSDEDVDIQLFDADGTKVVHWPDGLLNGPAEASVDYKGVTITYSGYNGLDGAPGHESIRLEGVLQNDFVMKAYGYAAGAATVDYSWEAKPGCVDSGSGSFEQHIPYQDVVIVGTIPAGKTNVRIDLASTVDVDIQLHDANGTEVVGWPDGLLNGASVASTTYRGVKITYSGYNGVDGAKGNEFIEIEGSTENDFVMKAYGYAAGTATVTYRWGPVENEISAEVVFSPRSYNDSHVYKVVGLIKQATSSIDIAMYNLSDSRVTNALKQVMADKGVTVRFIFHQAQAEVKENSLSGTKSGKLEEAGVDVRYVTKSKIMHHKYMIIDGPRLDETGYPDPDAARTAILVTGSGNWSSGAQTIYDENTLFLSGVPALVLAFQQEFNKLWNLSYDFVHKPLPFNPADAIDDSMWIDDDELTDVWFTSANFKDNQTFTVKPDSYVVTDSIVAELDKAQTSIYIASGHYRNWPIHSKLMQLKQERPGLDIKVYLDGQEYLSDKGAYYQDKELNACVTAAAGDPAKEQACYLSGNYWSRRLYLAGIPLRYKYYSYRWHYTYAKQMHHKYLIIDNKILITGSFNLSDNAERKTFENMVVLRGGPYLPLVQQFTDNFNELWATEEDGAALASLKQKIQTAPTIPLVFSPMALTWQQVADLRALIEQNCPEVDDDGSVYDTNPEDHTSCPRN